MDYKVFVLDDAERDIMNYIDYLLYVIKSEQAANNVFSDYQITLGRLSSIAGSLKLCENENLAAQGYRRINFESHNYFMMYRLIGEEVFVDRIFHGLQDYERKMI